MEVNEYIASESKYVKESIQIGRVNNIIVDWAKENGLEYIWFFRNVNYYHKSLGLKWSHKDWNGKIDLIFISDHHFVILELKNNKGVIIGKTQNVDWKIKYYESDEFIIEKKYFTQCSKMKAYFSIELINGSM